MFSHKVYMNAYKHIHQHYVFGGYVGKDEKGPEGVFTKHCCPRQSFTTHAPLGLGPSAMGVWERLSEATNP